MAGADSAVGDALPPTGAPSAATAPVAASRTTRSKQPAISSVRRYVIDPSLALHLSVRCGLPPRVSHNSCQPCRQRRRARSLWRTYQRSDPGYAGQRLVPDITSSADSHSSPRQIRRVGYVLPTARLRGGGWIAVYAADVRTRRR